MKLDGVFVLGPTSMDLKIDETMELTVYGFPTEPGLVEDVIVCRLAWGVSRACTALNHKSLPCYEDCGETELWWWSRRDGF